MVPHLVENEGAPFKPEVGLSGAVVSPIHPISSPNLKHSPGLHAKHSQGGFEFGNRLFQLGVLVNLFS